MTTKINRRENLRLLAKAMGGIGELAKFLDKSPSQLSHLMGATTTKNIGDRLAASIERAFAKPVGWLDIDHTQHVDEIFGQIKPPKDCYRVPLLNKNQVMNWILQANKSPNSQRYNFIYTSITVGALGYAMHVQTDSMEAPQGVSFPQDSMIIVDPDYPMKNDSYIVVCLEHETAPIFRQLKYVNNKSFLCALNPRYPEIPLGEKYLFCGVVRQVILNAR